MLLLSSNENDVCICLILRKIVVVAKIFTSNYFEMTKLIYKYIYSPIYSSIVIHLYLYILIKLFIKKIFSNVNSNFWIYFELLNQGIFEIFLPDSQLMRNIVLIVNGNIPNIVKYLNHN